MFFGNAEIEDFPGNYSDFRTYEDSNVEEARLEKQQNTDNKGSKNSWKNEDKVVKLSFMEQKEYNKLESEIRKLEKKKEELQHKFADVSLSGNQIDMLSIELKELMETIETKTERWFELSEPNDPYGNS